MTAQKREKDITNTFLIISMIVIAIIIIMATLLLIKRVYGL